MKSILDRSFRYVKSEHTDLRRTFARVRREQQALQEKQAANDRKVQPLKRERHGRS